MMKRITPEKRRQQILDYLNRVGQRTARQIAEAIGIDKQTVTTHLRDMRKDGEVASHEEFVGRVMVVRHGALVTKTVLSMSKKDRPPAPWITRNRCDDSKPPIRNQGGQGGVMCPRTSSMIDMLG